MTAHIIYFNYLKPDGRGMSIGGIQTYITNLVPVLRSEGFEVSIYQRGDSDFVVEENGATVYGVKTENPYGKDTIRSIYEFAKTKIDAKTDLLIFGCESCAVPCGEFRSVAIQHGISWDVPEFEGCSDRSYLYQYVRKCKHAWDTVKRVSLPQTLVCVDYNFINWYRAIVPYPKVHLKAIPNFTEIPAVKYEKQDDVVRIIFARRFFKHRGTRIFADAMVRVLSKYERIEVTVAGTGPDEKYVSNRLASFPNVKFTTYSSGESMRIHQDKDIAVVPTVGSEGTSLSLLEAMAAGCAVICTNVGGMTNLVFDHFNGLMISPEEEFLYKAVCELIENRELRERLQRNASAVVNQSFSLEVWQERWKEVIREAMS